MRLTRALSLTLLLTLAPAAAAHAAKISTTASEADYLAEGTDTISMSVHIGFDDDLRDTGVFFFPSDSTIVDPTTSDANCRARPTGASSCLYRGLTRITLLGQNDFVLVNAAGDTVRVDAGGGNDIVRTSGTGTKMVSNGEGGNDELMGGAGTDLLDGGPGDDKLVPLSFGDDVHGGTGFDTAQMQNGGVVATLDETQNDGPPGNTSENIHSDIERVVGGDGADDLSGNADANTLDGGSGNDAINGLAGADTLLGGIGDDVISARDGAADNVSCGPGADRAVVDPADTVASDCETVEYADGDHDGFDARTDCNDANAAVHPGAVDTPGNGVDEDCNGADAPVIGGTQVVVPGPTDADHDGTSPPVDCNDGSAAIHPGAKDTPGDGVDQDCSGADAQLPAMPAKVRDRWTVSNTRAHVDLLAVRGVPKGGRVVVDCKGGGCPFARRTVPVRRGKADVGKLFKRRQLKTGATVQVTVTAPGYVGKVMRYRFKGHRKVPNGQQLCLPPGALRAASCG